ncbi:sulfotransferase family 2 domain-containing protein [Celeribacter sp. PS-C1]|uniref:sulfotransferase family 2 domain-containing protein n=1 Tax=Celeribacter sp. PS-C1 TaxID=2820813 RepID=UPI001CA53CEE|nr:sulfotransferase family 2 domain-containing protein [Celeribacter sp. PS-C1]
MIFLRSSNVLFLKPKKTAGTSFEIALSRFAEEDDIITPISNVDEDIRRNLGFQTCQNYLKRPQEYNLNDAITYLRRGARAKKFYNHITAAKTRRRLGPNLFDAAYKVSIVRNPFDMIVSLYFWKTRKDEVRPSIQEWVKRNKSVLRRYMDQYYLNGTDIIDFYVRFENFEEDILELENRVPALQGLWSTFNSINAKGNIRPKKSAPSAILSEEPEVRQVVHSIFGDLIDRFDYRLT